jgi:hypothetical protein
MKRISLNMRMELDAQASSEIEAILVRIVTPDNQVIRLSTDPTERISVDPLRYGTRSTWLSDNGPETFWFIGMTAIMPDDQEDAPQAASIAFALIDAEISEMLRSTIERSRFDMALILASNPDLIEWPVLDLEIVEASGDASQVVIKASRVPKSSESWPKDRMTRQRFPSLHP